MNKPYINYIAHNAPNAIAMLKGSDKYPQLRANVELYQTAKGVLVVTEAHNLPNTTENSSQFFAYHIHSGESCSGNTSDPFADALTHYNPTDVPHPFHAGDLPPLLSNDGYAFSVVFVNKFTVKDVLNKAMIIHLNPDDFTTQPSGNSGQKIACGIIKPFYINSRFRF